VGPIAELVRSVQATPVRYATGVAVGPHFTALAAGRRPNGGAAAGGADAGGLAGPPATAGHRLPGTHPVSWRR
jgi:hypothetical protein